MLKYQLRRGWRASISVPCARACALIAAIFAHDVVALDAAAEKILHYEVVATLPHDVASFTQGLAFHEGHLIEGTGLRGRSALAIRDPVNGAVLRTTALPPKEFGEGVAFDGRHIVQLTWLSGVAYVYDLSLRALGQLRYAGEGWGLTHDGRRWLMSDGSSRITVRDGETFAPAGGFSVTDGGRSVTQLNELEWARGRLYANVWHSDRIAVIDPASGIVEAWLDLSALRRGFMKPTGWNETEHVLNGIAFNPASGHFYVTGKCWPVLYEIRLSEAAAP